MCSKVNHEKHFQISYRHSLRPVGAHSSLLQKQIESVFLGKKKIRSVSHDINLPVTK